MYINMKGCGFTVINKSKNFYIVISQPDTILSKLLKLVTAREYNHVSLSLRDDLSLMYSFGRLNPYYPFWGGFVTESVNFGTFKRFSNSKIIVLSVDISEEKHIAMCELMEYMLKCKNNYRYNYLGVFLAAFKIYKYRKNYYYCSEFVKDVLVKCDINGAEKLGKIVHPMNFLDMPSAKTVYCGKLKDYSLNLITEEIGG